MEVTIHSKSPIHPLLDSGLLPSLYTSTTVTTRYLQVQLLSNRYHIPLAPNCSYPSTRYYLSSLSSTDDKTLLPWSPTKSSRGSSRPIPRHLSRARRTLHRHNLSQHRSLVVLLKHHWWWLNLIEQQVAALYRTQLHQSLAPHARFPLTLIRSNLNPRGSRVGLKRT